jgi:cob(I)alamin adenosyltransferase
MLFTGKGDKGDTGTFGCKQRMSKSSAIAEALGTLDELNSYVGVCRNFPEAGKFEVNGNLYQDILIGVQQNLFIIQAQIAGADKVITEDKVKNVEDVVNAAEKEMPPIKSFFLPGGTGFGGNLDFARTLARRAERRVVAVSEEGSVKVEEQTLRYLNRLSSLMYALARLANHKSGITEQSPKY